MPELMVSFRRPDSFWIDLSRNPPGISVRGGWAKDLRLANWFEPYDDDERLALATVTSAMAWVQCHECRRMLQRGDRSPCCICRQEPVEQIARHLVARLPHLWIQFMVGDDPASLYEHRARLLREACERKRNTELARPRLL